MSKKKLAGIIVGCIIVVIVVVVITTLQPTPTPTYTLSVSVSPSGAGSVSPSGGEYESGVQITLTASPASGYTFDYWSGDATGNSSSVTLVMDNERSITAHFLALPGIGVPVLGDSWQITVEGASEETRLTARGSEYTPESGYTFLIVDVEFQNLGSEKMVVSSEAVTVITEEGKVITTAGGEHQGEDPALGYMSIWVVDTEDTLSLNFAFVVKEETIDQVFKFQFEEVPLIPFSVTKP